MEEKTQSSQRRTLWSKKIKKIKRDIKNIENEAQDIEMSETSKIVTVAEMLS